MKKIRRYRDEEHNFWSSFVDVMSTISLVFFFLMIVSIAITYTRYKQIQIAYDEIQTAYDKIDDIGKQRKELYEKVEETLKPKLGNNVTFSDGKLEIKTEVLFESNKYIITPEGQNMALQISAAFYDLLENKDYNSKIQSIEVRGHTDDSLGGNYNRYLSTNRATNFLNAMIPDKSKYEKYAYKFKASGMSKFVPKPGYGTLGNETPVQKAQNRRIEIYINVNDDDIAEAINNLINSSKK